MADLEQLIISLIPEIAEEQDVEVPAALDAETRGLGRDDFLDSLGLVNLIVALEHAIEDQHGVSVTLADEKAFSQKQSPYRSIGSLAAYARAAMEAAD